MTKIFIYNTGLISANNMIIENIDRFLAEKCNMIYGENNLQYIRTEETISVKLNEPQTVIDTAAQPDYLVIEQNNKRWYYYIDSAEQVAERTVKYVAHIDALNTFANDYEISEHSTIERQHEDRFVKTSSVDAADSTTVAYNIKRSRTTENLAPKLYKKLDLKVDGYAIQLDNHKWYLIYENDEEGRPVIDLVADEQIKLNHRTVAAPPGLKKYGDNWWHYGILPQFITDNPDLIFVLFPGDWSGKLHIENAPDIDLNGGTIIIRYSDDEWVPNHMQVEWIKPNGEVIQVHHYIPAARVSEIEVQTFTGKVIHWDYASSFDYQTMSDSRMTWNRCFKFTGDGTYIAGLDSIDRTKENITKIIECPYCPIEFTAVWNTVYGSYDYNLPAGFVFVDTESSTKYGLYRVPIIRTYQLDYEFKRPNLYSSFDMNKYFQGQFTITKTNLAEKETTEDPKIYNNETHKNAFVYADKEYVLPINEVEFRNTTGLSKVLKLDVDYCQSNAITSDLGFRFSFNDSDFTYKSQETFGEYMLTNRNNEVPIFTSAYLDYLRNGYNYDKQKLQEQTGKQVGDAVIKTTAGIITAVLGAATGNALGVGAGVSLVAQGAKSAFDIASTNKAGEMDIQQKINDAKEQAMNIAGSNDLALFKWYSDNKLHNMIFEPDDDTKSLVNKYYRLYGYSKGNICAPNTDTRYSYNYVRGDVEVVGINKQPVDKFKQIIRNKYAEGVYYVHNRAATRNHWDVDLECNNYETALLPTSWVAKAI